MARQCNEAVFIAKSQALSQCDKVECCRSLGITETRIWYPGVKIWPRDPMLRGGICKDWAD